MGSSQYPRVFTLAALLVSVAAGIYITLLVYDICFKPLLDVLPPFVIAFVFAFLLDPIVDWLGRRGLSRTASVATVGLVFVLGFVLIGFLLLPKIAEQSAQLAQNLPDFAKKSSEWINRLLVSRKSVLEGLHLPTTAGELARRFSGQLESAASSSLSFFATLLSGIVSKILWVIVIPLATFWLLKDLDYISAKVFYLAPERYRGTLKTLSCIAGRVFGRYIRGMIVVALIYSAVSSAWLTLAGLDYGLVIGSLSGLLYFVPYVGALAAITAAGIAAIASGHSTTYILAIVIGLAVQNFVVFDLMITPRVVGRSVGLHPVLVFFALALGARFFGIVGMIVAVPLLAAAQAALGEYYPRVMETPQADEST